MKYATDTLYRDLLLFTQQPLISKLNSNISTDIVYRDNNNDCIYSYLEKFNDFRLSIFLNTLNLVNSSLIYQLTVPLTFTIDTESIPTIESKSFDSNNKK